MAKLTRSMQAAREAIIAKGGAQAEQLPAFDQLVKQAQMSSDVVLQIFKKPNRAIYLVPDHIEQLDDLFFMVISQTVERCYASTMRIVASGVAERQALNAEIERLKGKSETVN